MPTRIISEATWTKLYGIISKLIPPSKDFEHVAKGPEITCHSTQGNEYQLKLPLVQEAGINIFWYDKKLYVSMVIDRVSFLLKLPHQTQTNIPSRDDAIIFHSRSAGLNPRFDWQEIVSKLFSKIYFYIYWMNYFNKNNIVTLRKII